MGEIDKSYSVRDNTTRSSKVTEREKLSGCKSEQEAYFFDWSTIIIPFYNIKSYKVH